MSYTEALRIVTDYEQRLLLYDSAALRMGHKLNKDQWIEYAEALRVVLQRAEQWGGLIRK